MGRPTIKLTHYHLLGSVLFVQRSTGIRLTATLRSWRENHRQVRWQST